MTAEVKKLWTPPSQTDSIAVKLECLRVAAGVVEMDIKARPQTGLRQADVRPLAQSLFDWVTGDEK